MATDLKISQMPGVAAIDGTEKVPVVAGGENRSVTVDGLAGYARQGVVMQEAGKGLSANDFTDMLKAKLVGLVNFDDTAIQAKLTQFGQQLENLLGEGASDTIDTFNEIEAFLAGITDKQTLTGLLTQLKGEITSATDTKLSGKVDKVTGKGLSSNDYTTEEKDKLGKLPDNGQMTVTGLLDKNTGLLYAPASSWRASELIPLNHNVPITAFLTTGSAGGKEGGVYFYAADRSYISYVNTPTKTETTIPVSNFPAGAAFFRCSSTWSAETKWGRYSNGGSIEQREGAAAGVISSGLADLLQRVKAYPEVTYNAATGYFKCNGLTDITPAQMQLILEHPVNPYVMQPLCGAKIRTNVVTAALNNDMAQNSNGFHCFAYICSAEVIRITRYNPEFDDSSWKVSADKTLSHAFAQCTNLKRIIGVINCSYLAKCPNAFGNCQKLEEVKLFNLKIDISFSSSPLLSLASLQYLVTNAANGSTAITVTVHPDVYVKLTDTANTEWYALLQTALGKNISFATNA